MPKKLYPADVLARAKRMLDAWDQVNPTLAFGDLDTAAMTTDIEQATALASRMKSLEVELVDLRNQRDAVYLSLWDKIKRVRSGVRAVYGDDSSQYEMVGGTRRSERKAPRPKS